MCSAHFWHASWTYPLILKLLEAFVLAMRVEAWTWTVEINKALGYTQTPATSIETAQQKRSTKAQYQHWKCSKFTLFRCDSIVDITFCTVPFSYCIQSACGLGMRLGRMQLRVDLYCRLQHFAASCQQSVSSINFLSQSMKLIDNFNGRQAPHSCSTSYQDLKCWDWKHQAGKCWDWQNGMALLGHCTADCATAIVKSIFGDWIVSSWDKNALLLQSQSQQNNTISI